MRIFSFISALAALVTTVVSVSVPDPCTNSEMKCDINVAPKRDFIEHPSRNVRAMTNAELLRRGLPLNRPVLRRGTPVRRTEPSSVPDPVKITHTGWIEVHQADGDNLLGYVSKNLGNGGAQFVYSPDGNNALLVSFQTDESGDGTQLDINAVDSNPDWPFLGLVQGRDDVNSNLSPGSYEYLYLGGVANPGTQPDDRPTLIDNSYFIGSPRTAETAVWTFTSSTGELTLQWVNEDGTYPEQQVWTQSAGLYVGGDKGAFYARYPAPVTPITFKFITTLTK